MHDDIQQLSAIQFTETKHFVFTFFLWLQTENLMLSFKEIIFDWLLAVASYLRMGQT